MKQIKITEELAKLIKSRKEKYLFEELSKGLTTGTYAFTVEKQVSWKEICGCENCGMCKQEHHLRDVIVFTAKIKPIALSNSIDFTKIGWDSADEKWEFGKFSRDMGNSFYNTMFDDAVISDLSYDFVKQNYIDTNIDFVVYEISEVKESE